MRGRHKTTKLAQPDNQSPFVEPGYLAFEPVAGLEAGLSLLPIPFLLGSADRQDQTAIPILGPDDVYKYGVAHVETLKALTTQALEFLAGHHPLRLGVDVHQHFGWCHADDDPVDGVPTLQYLETEGLFHEGIHRMIIWRLLELPPF